MNRIIAIYKKKGVSSNNALYSLKKKYPKEKVGHAGTLDPLAEGILVVGIGKKATKKLGLISKNTKKTYIAEIELGKNSTTDDNEGEKTKISNFMPVVIDVKKVLKTYIGKILQTPPQFSAIKVDGKRAYKKARKKEKFKLNPREIEIFKIKLIEYSYPILKLEITCGSGTYIRSLARDIGQDLKTGAYLKNLIRTAVGRYNIKNAVKLDF
jgi:tRNA pseudouridine55 synthase